MMFSAKMSLSKMMSVSTRVRPATASLSSFFHRPCQKAVASSSGTRSFSSAEVERPFKVLGIQQVAIGCETRDPLNKIWKDIFGLKEHTTMTLEKENVIEDIVKLGPAPYEVEIDLMCPFDVEKSPKVYYVTILRKLTAKEASCWMVSTTSHANDDRLFIHHTVLTLSFFGFLLLGCSSEIYISSHSIKKKGSRPST